MKGYFYGRRTSPYIPSFKFKSLVAAIVMACASTAYAVPTPSPSSDLRLRCDFDVTGIGATKSYSFGRVVASAGNIDAGFGDKVAVYDSANGGVIYIYSFDHRYAHSVCDTPIARISPPSPNAFGNDPRLLWVDLNADGQSELAIGNPEFANYKGVTFVATVKAFSGPLLSIAGVPENRAENIQAVAYGLVPLSPGGLNPNAHCQYFPGYVIPFCAVNGDRTGHALSYRVNASGVRTRLLSGKPGAGPIYPLGNPNAGLPVPDTSGAIEEITLLNTSSASIMGNVGVTSFQFGPTGVRDFSYSLAFCGGPTNHLAIGAPGTNSYSGAVYTRESHPNGSLFNNQGLSSLAPQITQSGSGGSFGAAISCFGQADNGANEAMIIGAPGGIGASNAMTGRAYLWRRGQANPDFLYDREVQPQSNVGGIVAAIGDANRDGKRDYVFGGIAGSASSYANSGYLYFVTRSMTANNTYNPDTRGLILGPNVPGARFARSVATVDLSDYGMRAMVVGKGRGAELVINSLQGYYPAQDFQLAVLTNPANPNRTDAIVVGSPFHNAQYFLFAATQPSSTFQLGGLLGVNQTLQGCIDPSTIVASVDFTIPGTNGTKTLPFALRNPTPGFSSELIFLQSAAFGIDPGTGLFSAAASGCAFTIPGVS